MNTPDAMGSTQPLLPQSNDADASPPVYGGEYTESLIERANVRYANFVLEVTVASMCAPVFFITALITTIALSLSVSDDDQAPANPPLKVPILLLVLTSFFLVISTVFWVGYIFLSARDRRVTVNEHRRWAEIACSVVGKVVFALLYIRNLWCYNRSCADFEIAPLLVALSIGQAWWDFALVLRYGRVMIEAYLDDRAGWNPFDGEPHQDFV